MRKTVSVFGAILMVFILSVSFSHAAAPVAEQELQKVLDGWSKGYNEKNADAIIALFDKQILFQGGNKMVVNYDGIVPYYKGLTYDAGRYSIKVITAKPLSQNIIVGFADMTVERADGSKGVSRVSLSLRADAENPGHWLITHWHFMRM